MKVKLSKKLMTYIGLIVLMLFILIPNLWMLSCSLKPDNEIFSLVPRWIPKEFTFEHYKWALGESGPHIGTLMFNSFFTSAVTAIMTMLFAATGGYALGRFEFTGKNVISFALLLSQMFQGPLIMIPWYKMATKLGILDTKLVLILVYGTATIPIGVWLMMGFFKALPKELEEAAEVDGCSKWTTFTKIIFPLVKPGLVSVCMYSFIMSWNDYQYALILSTSTKSKTIQLGIAELTDALGKQNWGGILASGIITTIPVIILFAVIQKQLIEGLTAGAVKG